MAVELVRKLWPRVFTLILAACAATWYAALPVVATSLKTQETPSSP